MNTRICALLTVGVVVAPALTTPSYSQDAPVASGSSVRVLTISTGEVLRGVVLENTDGRLSLRTGKRRVDVPVEDVRRLDLEVRDSLTEGAVIGAATLGLLCALVCGQGLDSGDLSQAVMTNAVVGAAIGAFLDSRMNARQVVYERSRSASQSRRASAVPLLTMRF